MAWRGARAASGRWCSTPPATAGEAPVAGCAARVGCGGGGFRATGAGGGGRCAAAGDGGVRTSRADEAGVLAGGAGAARSAVRGGLPAAAAGEARPLGESAAVLPATAGAGAVAAAARPGAAAVAAGGAAAGGGAAINAGLGAATPVGGEPVCAAPAPAAVAAAVSEPGARAGVESKTKAAPPARTAKRNPPAGCLPGAPNGRSPGPTIGALAGWRAIAATGGGDSWSAVGPPVAAEGKSRGSTRSCRALGGCGRDERFAKMPLAIPDLASVPSVWSVGFSPQSRQDNGFRQDKAPRPARSDRRRGDRGPRAPRRPPVAASAQPRPVPACRPCCALGDAERTGPALRSGSRRRHA